MNLMHQLVSACREYEKQTALRLNPEHLELHVHPHDWREFLRHESLRYLRFDEQQLMGIRVVVAWGGDIKVGHPELVSTWRMTL